LIYRFSDLANSVTSVQPSIAVAISSGDPEIGGFMHAAHHRLVQLGVSRRARAAALSSIAIAIMTASVMGLSGCGTQRTVAGPVGQQAADDRFVLARTPAAGRGPIDGEARWLEGTILPWNGVSMTPMMFETRKTIFSKDDAFAAQSMRSDLGIDSRTSHKFEGIDWTSTMEVRWHNVSFDDPRADAAMRSGPGASSRLLLSSRGIITGWQVFGSTRDMERKRGYVKQELTPLGLAFMVTQHDHSRDGWLDNRDGRQLLITDHDGSNPRFVTPKDANVETVVFNQQTQALIITLRVDSNNDGTFDLADSTSQVTLAAPYTQLARAMTPEDVRRSAESIWK
jgi:hypothetical protein